MNETSEALQETLTELRWLDRRDVYAGARLLFEINDGKALDELASGLEEMRRAAPAVVLGAYHLRGELAGLITGGLDPDDRRLGWSHDLVVRPAFRGTGLGSRLLMRQLEGFRVLRCQAVRGQSPAKLFEAVPFFLHHGFRIVEERVSKGDWGIADGQRMFITEIGLWRENS